MVIFKWANGSLTVNPWAVVVLWLFCVTMWAATRSQDKDDD